MKRYGPASTAGDEKTKAPKVDFKSLDASQKKILQEALNGKSLFYTGAAGTGKTFLLRAIIKSMYPEGGNVYVTASTGKAACAIGGTTLHSFAGVGLGNGKAEELAETLLTSKMPSHRKAVRRWRTAKTLIIGLFDIFSNVILK